MTPEALLAELEPLTHRARMRRMVDLGLARTRGDDPEVAPLLDALSRHPSAYARLLALQSCCRSRDGAHVLRAIEDPSRTVRARAARLVPLACDDAQAAAAVGLATGPRARSRLLAALRRRGRARAVDAFLDARLGPAPSRPDGRAVDLLALGSSEVIARHLPVFREASSPLAWQRLTVWQPAVAGAELGALLAGEAPVDPRLRWQLGPTIQRLARGAPDVALGLVRRLFAHGLEPRDPLVCPVLQALVRRRPCETFDLLRERHEAGAAAAPPGAFVVRFFEAHRLGGERIAYLMRRAPGTLPEGDKGRRWLLRLDAAGRARVLAAWMKEVHGSWGAFLLRHIPAEGELAAPREASYQRWSVAAQSREGTISPVLLEWLPADLRIREARRHLESVQALATKPERRLPYAGLLPFADAREALAPWLGHPEGEQRALALRTLLGALRFDRARMADALSLVHAKKFEQDPVRLAILGALAGLPRRCFAAVHLEAVGEVVEDALDAADLSAPTASQAEALVVRLFRLDAAWGARWLTRLLAARGSVSSRGLGDDLTRPEVQVLAPVLAGLAEAWRTRERAGALIWLAASLGKRLDAVPALVEALASLAVNLPFVHVAAMALGLLSTRARPHFAALVPELVAADASFGGLGVVARYLSLARQDLLGPLLGDAPVTGRFATGQTRWAIDFGGGYARWTERQQATHAAALAAVAADVKRDVPAIRAALRALTRLCFAPPDAVIACASDRRPPVREIAVRALPWLDGGEGVPVLLECLSDDRARWAIYALRKVLAEMDEGRVRAVLRGAPTHKVTVAKEVVRLLGELPGDEAFADLCALDRPELHRDVLISLLRALWDHLERPAAWSILERAAASTDWVVAAKLADVPVGRLSTEAERRVCRFLVQVLGRPELEARIELLGRIAAVPLRDVERVIFRECLARMASPHPDECGTATSAALTRMLPGEADAVSARIRALLARHPLLAPMVAEVTRRLGPYAPAHLTHVGHGVLAGLAADPLVAPQYLTLAPRLLAWKELTEALVSLSARDLLHADAMAAALGSMGLVLHPELVEQGLAGHADPRLRRLALAALVSAARPDHGWSKDRRQRLERYRADPAPLVAGAAAFVFPPE